MKTQSSAEQILKELLDGNQRFLNGQSLQSSASSLARLKNFAKIGQSPKAIVLCCSDSRAPVEMIFDQDIGDLFVIRVAGNVVAPSLIGSVEFAASTFACKLVLVMGHTQCGAVIATLDHIQNMDSPSSENLHDILARIKPHVFSIARMKNLSSQEKVVKALEANVIASVSQLSTSSRLLEKMISEKRILVAGAVLDLNSGQVSMLEV